MAAGPDWLEKQYFKEMTYEDYLAQMCLALLYTTNHVDVVVQPNLTGVSAKKIPGVINSAAANAPYYDAAVIRRIRPGTSNPNISDVDYDTVAIAIGGDTLYIACNHKTRRNDGDLLAASKPSHLSYSGFNQIGDPAMEAIRLMLGREKKEGCPELKSVTQIRWIVSTPEPKDEVAAAKVHAEMVLLSYLKAKTLSVARMGVNKDCCAGCFECLQHAGIACPPKGKRFANWTSPDNIASVVKETVALSTPM